MSTAAAEPVQRPEPNVDETIRRTVRALRSAREIDAKPIADHLRISRASLYNRLNGAAPFLAAEIAGLAHFFGVPITDFYEGIVRVGTATPPVLTQRYPIAERRLVVVSPQVTDSSSCVGPTSVVPNVTTGRAVAGVINRTSTNRTSQCETAA